MLKQRRIKKTNLNMINTKVQNIVIIAIIQLDHVFVMKINKVIVDRYDLYFLLNFEK